MGKVSIVHFAGAQRWSVKLKETVETVFYFSQISLWIRWLLFEKPKASLLVVMRFATENRYFWWILVGGSELQVYPRSWLLIIGCAFELVRQQCLPKWEFILQLSRCANQVCLQAQETGVLREHFAKLATEAANHVDTTKRKVSVPHPRSCIPWIFRTSSRVTTLDDDSSNSLVQNRNGLAGTWIEYEYFFGKSQRVAMSKHKKFTNVISLRYKSMR